MVISCHLHDSLPVLLSMLRLSTYVPRIETVQNLLSFWGVNIPKNNQNYLDLLKSPGKNHP